MMEYDVHTVLDLLTLAATAWVIYTLRVTLKDSYQNEQDTIQTYYVVRSGTHCVLITASVMQFLSGGIKDNQKLAPISCLSKLDVPVLRWPGCVQIIPCALLAAIAHPGTNHPLVFRVRMPLDLHRIPRWDDK